MRSTTGSASIRASCTGSTRWPWISEAYEYVQTIYLVKGIWGVLLNPRKPTFNVTAKGLTLDNDHLSELAWPYFVAFGAILMSLVVAVWRFLSENEVNELLLIVGGWSFYNLLIAGVALAMAGWAKMMAPGQRAVATPGAARAKTR